MRRDKPRVLESDMEILMDILFYALALSILLFLGFGGYLSVRWGGPRRRAPDEARPYFGHPMALPRV
jgi:hypothetical protein